MARYLFHVDTGFVGSDKEEEFELDDAMSEEELEEFFREWLFNAINSSWKKIG